MSRGKDYSITDEHNRARLNLAIAVKALGKNSAEIKAMTERELDALLESIWSDESINLKKPNDFELPEHCRTFQQFVADAIGEVKRKKFSSRTLYSTAIRYGGNMMD